jgi:hypothetical protein
MIFGTVAPSFCGWAGDLNSRAEWCFWCVFGPDLMPGDNGEHLYFSAQDGLRRF